MDRKQAALFYKATLENKNIKADRLIEEFYAARGETNTEIDKKLAEYNGIEDEDHIMPGDVIRLPNIVTENGELQPTTIQTYTVQPGDNLTTICKKIYNDDSYELVLRLAKYNGIENPDFIKQGQVLELPMYEELQEINVITK